MEKVLLSDIFREDYLRTVSIHIKRIQRILDEYDVAIFMARKAICFYEALKANGEIKETKCRTVSSRIIYYNLLENYRDMKVAVIDDVVVRGKSIDRVAKTLKDAEIKADYYVAACEDKFRNEFEQSYNFSIQTHITYSRNDIYHFSGLITQYIEASMRTFNVDSPIYDVTSAEETVETILRQNGAVSLTSGLQAKYKVRSKSVYFKYIPKSQSEIEKVLSDSVIKIRFYYSDNRVIAVPFVLLPACDIETLDSLYQLMKSDQVDSMVFNINGRRIRENKHKLISYCLADALFCWFAEKTELTYTRDVGNDILQFDRNLDDIVPCDLRKKQFDLMTNVSNYKVEFSRFLLTNYIKDAYLFVSDWDPYKQPYEDANGVIYGNAESDEEGKLGRIAFSLADILKWINSRIDDEKKNTIYVSSVIDVFVDMGFIVPAILHTSEDNVLRAYKLGEYSKLERDQINSFSRMLHSYQENIGRNLDKIELEKLCVLFFKTSIRNGFFASKTYFEEGDYSIAYSFYGPRISTSEKLYTVSKESAFITDLIDEKILTEKNGKYVLRYGPSVESDELCQSCEYYAGKYAELNQVFAEHPYIPKRKDVMRKGEQWNQYVHTLNQFLTLLAIGKNVRDQILSLCAEVNLVTKLNKGMFLDSLDKLHMYNYRLYLSGINSGMWKYRCYKENALAQTVSIIGKYNKSVAYDVMQPLIGPTNRDPGVLEFLDECGIFLFQAAYVINELLNHTKRTKEFSFDNIEGIDYNLGSASESEKETRVIFDTSSYYYDKMRDHRKKICDEISSNLNKYDEKKVIEAYISTLQRGAKNILDKCDLYLSEEDATGQFVESFLIVHSERANLPIQFVNVAECHLENVSETGKTCVFSILFPQDLERVVSEVLSETWYSRDCEYVLVRQAGRKFGYIQISNIAKGTAITEDINQLLNIVHKLPKTGRFLYVYQSDESVFNEFGDYVVMNLREEEYNSLGRLYTYSIIAKGGQPNIMIDNSVHNNNTTVFEKDAKIGILNNGDMTAEQVVGSFGNCIPFDVDKCLQLIDDIKESAQKSTGLSEGDKANLEINLGAIEAEAKKEKPRKSIIKAATSALEKIKNPTSVAAAIVTLINFFKNL